MKILVGGTPFAGMSVVGEALSRAGIYLGAPIGMPRINDATSMFVNRRLVALHDRALIAAGASLLAPPAAVPPIDDVLRAEARALLEAQVGDRAAWALVDPRLVLFADLWNELVPDARWVFVIRPPAETAWTLLRRHAFADPGLTPWRRAQKALGAWTTYATAVAAQCRRAPGRSLVLFAPDDFGDAGDAQLATLTGCTSAVGSAYHPPLLQAASPRWIRLQARLSEEVRTALDQVRACRTVQRRPDGSRDATSRPARGTGPVICVASRRRLAISETFIREHVCQLPGSVRWVLGDHAALKRDKDGLPLNTVVERAISAGMAEFGHTGTRLVTRGIARYLRREGVRVVLAQFGPVAIDYMDACGETGIPLVVHFHGYDVYKRSTLTEFGWAYPRLFAMAGAIVAVSHDMMDTLAAMGAPREKLFWSPCGVDTTAFHGADPAAAEPLIVYVGRFVPKKAPQNALLAFHHVAQRRPDARLLMIGDGPMLDPCRHLCESLGLQSRVEFTGASSPTEIAARLRTARVFVQHSIVDDDGNAEGTPVSVLEAGATGLPVVSTRHKGIMDVVVQGETGFLVEEGDIERMGEHLLALCDDPALAGTMGQRGRARVIAEFSREPSLARLWRALEHAMGRGVA